MIGTTGADQAVATARTQMVVNGLERRDPCLLGAHQKLYVLLNAKFPVWQHLALSV